MPLMISFEAVVDISPDGWPRTRRDDRRAMASADISAITTASTTGKIRYHTSAVRRIEAEHRHQRRPPVCGRHAGQLPLPASMGSRIRFSIVVTREITCRRVGYQKLANGWRNTQHPSRRCATVALRLLLRRSWQPGELRARKPMASGNRLQPTPHAKPEAYPAAGGRVIFRFCSPIDDQLVKSGGGPDLRCRNPHHRDRNPQRFLHTAEPYVTDARSQCS